MSKVWKCGRTLPIFILVGVPLSIFSTYGLAIIHKHVNPLLPYVSDTGTFPPESCFFSFFFSIFSFILCCAAYIRYREVAELLKLRPRLKITPACNVASIWIAFFSAFGLLIVACFQETNMFIVHFAGALMCFFGGTAYFIFQTIFTARISPKAKCMFYTRVLLTTVNILCTTGTFAPLHFAIVDFKGDNPLKWSEKDGGYAYHLISTFSEWLLIFSFVAYMSTLFWDFRKFNVEPPVIKFKDLAGMLGEVRPSVLSQPTVKPKVQPASAPSTPPPPPTPPPRPPPKVGKSPSVESV